jgi:oxygen-independent coproporphyrinogen-3 oxidase
VNRLSVGIQSFQEDELRFLSRIHDAQQAVQCVADAHRAGFTNVSVDLIFSLPGQTLARWEENLRRALELDPQHVSAYSLIVEANTPLARHVAAGDVVPNDEAHEAAMYEFTMEYLATHGFEHYEVSNYAKPGFRSRHNSNYWNHEDYLGFGPSAHSFWNEGTRGRRWWNISHIGHYCTSISSGKTPVASEETVGRHELMNERVFLGLRSDGIDLRRFTQDFGVPLPSHMLDLLLGEKYAQVHSDKLHLTPKGYLLCDEIAGRMMV